MYSQSEIDQLILSLAERGLTDKHPGQGFNQDQLKKVKERIGNLRKAVNCTDGKDYETHGLKSLAKLSSLKKYHTEQDSHLTKQPNTGNIEANLRNYEYQNTVKKAATAKPTFHEMDKETLTEPKKVRNRFYSTNSEEEQTHPTRLKPITPNVAVMMSSQTTMKNRSGGLNKLDELQSLKHISFKPPLKQSPRLLRGQSGSLPKPAKGEKSKDVVEIARNALTSDVLLKMMQTPMKAAFNSGSHHSIPPKHSLLSSSKKEGSARKSSHGSDGDSPQHGKREDGYVLITPEKEVGLFSAHECKIPTYRSSYSSRSKVNLTMEQHIKERSGQCKNTPSFPLQPTTPKALKGHNKQYGDKEYGPGALPSPVTESPSETQSNFFDSSMHAISKAIFRD